MTEPYCIGSFTWAGLSKLIEECGEVQQVAGKIIGNEGRFNHWDGSYLPDRLQEELGDLLAAIGFFIEINGADRVVIDERARKKLAQFYAWHTEQGGVVP